jgi:hypothetical protein
MASTEGEHITFLDDIGTLVLPSISPMGTIEFSNIAPPTNQLTVTLPVVGDYTGGSYISPEISVGAASAETFIPVLVEPLVGYSYHTKTGYLILDNFTVEELEHSQSPGSYVFAGESVRIDQARSVAPTSSIQVIRFTTHLAAIDVIKRTVASFQPATKIELPTIASSSQSVSQSPSSGRTTVSYSCRSYELPCLIDANYEGGAADQVIVKLDLASNLNQLQLMTRLREQIDQHGRGQITVIRRYLRVGKIQTHGSKFTVQITGALAVDMTKIRHIILEDIPTMAVKTIWVHENRTIWSDENIYQLLASLVFNSTTIVAVRPLLNDVQSSSLKPDRNLLSTGAETKFNGSIPMVEGEVRYYLEATGEPGKIVTVTGRNLTPIGNTYDVVPVEYAVDMGQGNIELMGQTILKLLPDNSLRVECLVSPGTQKQDARWGCVTNLTFDGEPGYYELSGVVRGNLTAEQIIASLTRIINRSLDLRLI